MLKTTPFGIVVVVPTTFLLSVPRLSKTAVAPPQYWKSCSPEAVNTPLGLLTIVAPKPIRMRAAVQLVAPFSSNRRV